MKFNKSKLAKGLGATGVVATPTGLWIDQLLKGQEQDKTILEIKQNLNETKQTLSESQGRNNNLALSLHAKEAQINDMIRDTHTANLLNSQMFENQRELLDASLEENERLKQLVEYLKSRNYQVLEETITDLTDELSRVNNILYTKEEELEELRELYIDGQKREMELRKLNKKYQDSILDMMKDRTQFQKWQALNPVEMKPGCWVGRYDDESWYGLNCKQKWITNGGKNIDIMFVSWANRDEHKEAYQMFKDLFTQYGDGAWDGKTPPKPPR